MADSILFQEDENFRQQFNPDDISYWRDSSPVTLIYAIVDDVRTRASAPAHWANKAKSNSLNEQTAFVSLDSTPIDQLMQDMMEELFNIAKVAVIGARYLQAYANGRIAPDETNAEVVAPITIYEVFNEEKILDDLKGYPPISILAGISSEITSRTENLLLKLESLLNNEQIDSVIIHGNKADFSLRNVLRMISHSIKLLHKVGNTGLTYLESYRSGRINSTL